MRITNRHFKDVIVAMMYASGLDPLFDSDYYQNMIPSNIGNFINGLVSFFELGNDSWYTNYWNLEYLDSPSKTIDFLMNNKKDLLDKKYKLKENVK